MSYPTPIIDVIVYDEHTRETYFEYSDDGKHFEEQADNVEAFLQVMFEAYKQLGFVNPLEVKVSGMLGGDDLNVWKFDPQEGDKPIYMENIEE